MRPWPSVILCRKNQFNFLSKLSGFQSGLLRMKSDGLKKCLGNEFWFPQTFKLRPEVWTIWHCDTLPIKYRRYYKPSLRGKVILIVKFILAIYWTIGWCYRLATRKWPKIPYIEKNITYNGSVIETVTAVEDIWFNDTTCEIEFQTWIPGLPGSDDIRLWSGLDQRIWQKTQIREIIKTGHTTPIISPIGVIHLFSYIYYSLSFCILSILTARPVYELLR